MKHWLIFFLLVVSCTQPQEKKLPWDSLPVVTDLEPHPMTAMLDSLVAAPPIYASSRVVYGKTACQWSGLNPIVDTPKAVPIAGKVFSIRWHVEGTLPVSQSRVVSLLCSTRSLPSPAPLNSFGATGCWLLVNPDFVMIPQQSNTGMLRYNPVAGIVTLVWNPDTSLIGSVFTSQLLVAAPGANNAGFLLSPALELVVGNQ